MAQTGYTPIQLYYSTTASQQPSAGNLANGELAINITDKKLYAKDNLGSVFLLASAASSTASVSTVSVVSANGLAGTVANATTTPAITLSTSVTGVLKGNGTAISAATAGTDYLAPPSGTSILKANSGGALANATAGTDYVAPGTATTFTATQTLSGSSSSFGAILKNAAESVNVVASAPSATTNLYFSDGAVQYYTSNASTNFTLNLAFSSGTSLNTALAVGQSATTTLLVTNGGTAYYPNAFQIDGSSVTPKWQGGTTPSSGNTNAIDAYTIMVTKTASATYTVLASQVKFA